MPKFTHKKNFYGMQITFKSYSAQVLDTNNNAKTAKETSPIG